MIFTIKTVRKTILITLAFMLMMAMSSCGKNSSEAGQSYTSDTATIATNTAGTETDNVDSADGNSSEGADENTASNSADGSSAGGDTTVSDIGGTANHELLNSASVDLDNDGHNEQIEAYQIDILSSDGQPTDEIEGLLIITGQDKKVQIPFMRKAKGFSGLMSGMEFEDLDRDGAKDVFIIIPGEGASFAYNYFFMYNYKTGKSHSFSSDEDLFSFAGSFYFKYKGGGALEMKSTLYGFTADFDISDSLLYETDDTANSAYGTAYIEPVPVEISADSTLALVRAADGSAEIKVPLPVFGLATVDMIGEVDIYYIVDENFKPVMKRAEIMDFDKGGISKIGAVKLLTQ